ncbi:hypothetical protein Tco_0525521 [Tanacetum coccineum]
MNSLRAIHSQLKFLIETLQDFGNMPIFKRTFSQDLDLLEDHLTKNNFSDDWQDYLTYSETTFGNVSVRIKVRMQNYTRYDAQSFYDAMIFNMDSLGKYMLELILRQQRTPQLRQYFSENASNKLVKECSLNSETKDVHAIKFQVSKAKKGCIAYFHSLHSHLQVLFKEDLKGTRIEHGFKRAFMSLFGQDVDTFTRTMLLNFQKFIDSKFTLDYDSQMTDTYFVEYTGIEVQHFRDTLLQHLGNVKKSVAERTRHQRQYERRVNKRQMQTQESKIDTGKALDADLVDTESIRTDSTVQDDNSRSGNDTDADDADIRPIYDEEPMAEVQLTAGCNIFAIGQQHTEQPEIINEGRVDQYPETCQVKSPMLDSSPDNQTTEYSKQSLRQHGQILKQTSNKAKIEKEIDVLETMNIELEHSVATLRKENETLKQHYKDLYDSIKITRSKTTEQTTSLLANNAELKAQIQEKVFAIAALKNDLRKLKGNSVDTKFDKTSVLGKPVLQSLRNQSVVRQPNAFKSARAQMSKQRFASQVDVNKNLSKPVTQHYLPKKTESAFAKPDHCVFNANHDACITKLHEGSKLTCYGSSNKTTNGNKSVEQLRICKKPERTDPTRHRTVGLRWVPTGKIFTPSTTKVDSEPPNGSNADITNQYESAQTLDVSAVSTEVHQAAETVTTSKELDLLFDPLFDEYFNGENQVVLKSSAVTTTDASNKRQQQPDSTLSTSTLATIVTADGNFDLWLVGISPYVPTRTGGIYPKTIHQLDNSSLSIEGVEVNEKGNMIVDIEDDIMDPVMQCTTLPSHSGFSSKKLVSLVSEITTLSLTSHSEIVDIE